MDSENTPTPNPLKFKTRPVDDIKWRCQTFNDAKYLTGVLLEQSKSAKFQECNVVFYHMKFVDVEKGKEGFTYSAGIVEDTPDLRQSAWKAYKSS